MKVKKIDKKNRFVSIFDTNTGFYMRTGIIDKEGKDTGEDPFMASFPELLDIGIMGSCVHGRSGLCAKSGVQCYQNGLKTQHPNMTLEQLKYIVDQCKGKCFQFALGGRGDVDQHEQFEEIMKYCRENNIVPNFTSSGLGFTEDTIRICKQYAGAIAVSEYRSEYTRRAIKMLVEAGITTNIHYVLGNNTIDEAIYKLKNNEFDKGINAVIFLLHKPVGLGQQSNVLKANDPRVKEFYELIDTKQFDFSIGFDSCNIPGLLNFTHNINRDSFDTCEGSRFSAYITSDMQMLPCSFDNQDLKYAVDLNKFSIQKVWNSEEFNKFRNYLKYSCKSCSDRRECCGGCPLVNNIVLCNRKERDFNNGN